MLSLSKTQLNSRCECQRNRGGGSQSESCVRPVFLQLSRNMHVIFCTYDSSVNEQFLLHNISFCIGAPSTIFSNLYVCIALWVLFEFCDYPLSSCLTPAFPVHAQFSCFLFPLHPNPSLLLFLVFFQRSGEERLRGVGMRRREGQESMKGRVGRGVWMASVWERKENDCVCVCVSAGAQPPDRFSVSVIDPVSSDGVLIYSVLLRRTLALFENPAASFFPATFPQLPLLLLWRFHCGHISILTRDYFIFPPIKIKATDSSPHASSFVFFCISESNIKEYNLVQPHSPHPSPSLALHFSPRIFNVGEVA